MQDDKRLYRVEHESNQLGAAVSLALDDIAVIRAKASAAEERLSKLQAEIEHLYIVLNEPLSIAIDEP